MRSQVKGRINYRVDNTDLFGCLYLLDWTTGMDYWTDLLCPVIIPVELQVTY